MKNKILKVTVGILAIGIISFYSIYFIQNKYVINTLDNLFMGADIEKGDLTKIKSVRCNLNIFEPEYAISHDLFNNISNEFNIYFFNQKSIFDFEIVRTGGTTIKNTTFPELLKMVKKDCSQFQKGGEKNNIEWYYSKSESAEEIKKEELENKKQKEREDEDWEKMTDKEKKKFIELRNVDLRDFGLEIIE